MIQNKLKEFKFPRPTKAEAEFHWDGRWFVGAEGEQASILSYSETQSNWSDDLTNLHEQEAGRNHPIDRASRALAIRSLKSFVNFSAPIVLEIGCSSGFLLEELICQLPEAAIIGADYIEPVLQRLAKRLPEVPILQFDLRSCPLPDKCVDAVVCLNVLEHIDDDTAAIRHIARILKPGGIAHIEVPSGPYLYDVYDELLMHHRRYRMAGLVRLVRSTGLEVVRKTHLGFFVFPAFAATKLANRWRQRTPTMPKKDMVASRIRKTSGNPVFRFFLSVENYLGRWVGFPFGIRCVLVVRKP